MEIGRPLSEILGNKAEVVAGVGSSLLEKVKGIVPGTAFKTIETLPAKPSISAPKPEGVSPRKPTTAGPKSGM